VIELVVPALRERRDEIPTLVESFIARYARKYRRPAPRLSSQLRQLFQTYDWPGNIRELENMIKRLVILQDEQIAFDEIDRNMQRAAAKQAAVAAVPATPPPQVPVPEAAVPAPPVEVADVEPELEVAASAESADDSQGSLAAVSRAAAMKAERALIEKTLNQVHWNRRKASQILGVSYKTLLNKIKECSISRD
jgi:two-component system response regulator AtoC